MPKPPKMKRFKIATILVILLASGTNYQVHAEEVLRSVSELLEIITHNHDNSELVYEAASELEKQTPATEEEIVQLF